MNEELAIVIITIYGCITTLLFVFTVLYCRMRYLPVPDN